MLPANVPGAPASEPSPGAVAQLGERLICIQEVVGSIPVRSTIVQRFEAVTHAHSQRMRVTGW